MTELNLYSFLSVFFVQLIGAYVHFKKMKMTKRTRVNYFTYLFADSKDKSTATFILMLGGAWFSCTAGSGDLLNIQLLWEFLKNGILHIPSVNSLIVALTAGYTFDSISNKGAV